MIGEAESNTSVVPDDTGPLGGDANADNELANNQPETGTDDNQKGDEQELDDDALFPNEIAARDAARKAKEAANDDPNVDKPAAPAKKPEEKKPEQKAPAQPPIESHGLELPPEDDSPKKQKYTVFGEEREFTREEIQHRLNIAEHKEHANEKFQQATNLRHDAEELSQSARQALANVVSNGPQVMIDLRCSEGEDPEQARDQVKKQLMKWLKPLLEEDELPEEERYKLRAQREAYRAREDLKRTRAQAEMERLERQRLETAESEKNEEIYLRNGVISKLRESGLPNDELARTVYEGLRAIAKDMGRTLTADMVVSQIRARQEAIEAKVRAAMDQKGNGNGNVSGQQNGMDRQRAATQQRRAALEAGKRTAEKKPSVASSPQRPKRQTMAEVRETLGL
jgi:hypothetical protein